MHVRLWLLALGIKFETTLIDEDDKPVWFTQLSKLSTLPLLRDKEHDLCITDAADIIVHIRETVKQPDLSAPLEQGKLSSIDLVHDVLDLMRVSNDSEARDAKRAILSEHFSLIDDELARISFDFFGGPEPNAVDLDLISKLHHVLVMLNHWDEPFFNSVQSLPALRAYMVQWESIPYWNEGKDPLEAVIAHWDRWMKKNGIDGGKNGCVSPGSMWKQPTAVTLFFSPPSTSSFRSTMSPRFVFSIHCKVLLPNDRRRLRP